MFFTYNFIDPMRWLIALIYYNSSAVLVYTHTISDIKYIYTVKLVSDNKIQQIWVLYQYKDAVLSV